MAFKRITIRLSESEFQTIQARAAAANSSVAEVVRALAVSSGGGGSTEGLTDAIASTLTSIAERIEQIESGGQGAAVDLSPALKQIETLTNAQARTERAIGALIDVVEKLQNRYGYSDPAPQNFSSQPQPAQHQNQPQPTPATTMSFTAWKMANPIREGESPADFNARSRAEYTAAGGRL
ncbi:hypothetical protein PTW32_09820 [Dechloromonas agitata]|uniref:hypothetical protein n=1 Tax=Dechloromonas agitata TaxID=73030 RepID=UPI00237D70A6|nr:hypothetical protein [Dechloromonas agitata]MDE1545720.1 hypothetical protein [Dechloromonas agitata]